MSRFVDFIVYPGIFIRKIPPRFAVSVIFYQIYSTDVHSLWRSLFVIFIEIKYRESFHRIPEFHFERFFIIFLFLPLLLSSPYLLLSFPSNTNFVQWKFLVIINMYYHPYYHRILSKNSWLRIHVFSSDTFERYFLTFFTQVIPIEITYPRIRSIGDSRRSTGGSRPTRWDSVSTMHFSRSPRRLVHTKDIRNCCCYVAPRGGHL